MFLLPAFSVGVSAAEVTNLIDSNLMNWDTSSDSTFNEVWSDGNVSHIRVFPQATEVGNGVLNTKIFTYYDLTNLKAGRSYTFSFHLLDLDEAHAVDSSVNWEHYYSGLVYGGFYVIGLGSWDSATNTVNYIEDSCITVNLDNRDSLFGSDIDISFEFTNLINPCIFIGYVEYSEYSESQSIMISNPQLIDNDSAEEEGFFKRLFEWLEIRFNNLSSSFTDLGDRIKVFFSDLSSNISDGLSDVRDGITTKFAEFEGWLSSLGDRISVFFTNLGSSISNGLSDVRDKINNKIAEVSEKFSDFFDKFKPRVHLNLDWSRGNFNGNGEVILEDNPNIPVIIVSELFEVPSDSSYYVTYNKFDSYIVSGAGILQYDLSGNFLGVLYSTNHSFEEYELPSGYMYRFRQSWTRGIEVDDDTANQHFSLYCDSGWLNALLFNFKSMIIGLFVPDEEDITTWKANLEMLFSDNLGFIYQIPDLFSNLVTKLRDIFVRDDFSFSIKLPQLDFKLFGHDTVLWEEKTVDFSYIFEEGIFNTLYGMYKVMLYVIFGFALVKYGWRVFEEMMQN